MGHVPTYTDATGATMHTPPTPTEHPREVARRARQAGLARKGGPLTASTRRALVGIEPTTRVPGTLFNRAWRRGQR